MKFKKIPEYISKVFYRLFFSLEKQAIVAGVHLGKNNFIASRFWSSEPYLITIGNNCQITAGVKMFTHGGCQVLRDKYPDFDVFGKIKIGNYVYIGSNTLINAGVTIEDNVLIASGSVVTKSLKARGVYGGNPAKYICSIDEFEKRNMIQNVSSKHLSKEEKKKLLLSLPDNKFISKDYIKL